MNDNGWELHPKNSAKFGRNPNAPAATVSKQHSLSVNKALSDLLREHTHVLLYTNARGQIALTPSDAFDRRAYRLSGNNGCITITANTPLRQLGYQPGTVLAATVEGERVILTPEEAA